MAQASNAPRRRSPTATASTVRNGCSRRLRRADYAVIFFSVAIAVLLCAMTDPQARTGWRFRLPAARDARIMRAVRLNFWKPPVPVGAALLAVPSVIVNDLKDMARSKAIMVQRAASCGSPKHTTRLASFAALRAGHISEAEHQADLAAARLGDRGRHRITKEQLMSCPSASCTFVPDSWEDSPCAAVAAPHGAGAVSRSSFSSPMAAAPCYSSREFRKWHEAIDDSEDGFPVFQEVGSDSTKHFHADCGGKVKGVVYDEAPSSRQPRPSRC